MPRLLPRSYASLTIDDIQHGLSGGTSTLLFASKIVSGLSVLSRTVSETTFGKYKSSSCIDPESVISAQQWPLSKNSMTLAYSFQSGVIRNLSGYCSDSFCNLVSRSYCLRADAV